MILKNSQWTINEQPARDATRRDGRIVSRQKSRQKTCSAESPPPRRSCSSNSASRCGRIFSFCRIQTTKKKHGQFDQILGSNLRKSTQILSRFDRGFANRRTEHIEGNPLEVSYPTRCQRARVPNAVVCIYLCMRS